MTTVELPVRLRVGEADEAVIGTITLTAEGGVLEDMRPALAGLLRSAADTIERTDLTGEEATDAAPR